MWSNWVYRVYAKEWFYRAYAKELIIYLNYLFILIQVDRQSESAILWIYLLLFSTRKKGQNGQYYLIFFQVFDYLTRGGESK